MIVDTAGRLAVDSEMMDEIENIKNAINPQEVLFVVDAMTGQDAVNTAREFNERLDFDGVVLTKLDGDTRGGSHSQSVLLSTSLSSLSVLARSLTVLSLSTPTAWPSEYLAWAMS